MAFQKIVELVHFGIGERRAVLSVERTAHVAAERREHDRGCDVEWRPVFGGDQTFWANPDQTDSRWWRFGNAGLRLPGLRSPGFYNIDTSLSKQFHVTETAYFDFRWEAFNTLNHQNLGLPNTNFCLPPTASGGTDLVHQAGCQFGRITNIQTDPRAMEFALKFYW